MLLIARSYNLPLYKTTDINEITWDAEAEPDYEAQRLAYPQKLLWYSAREKDLALPAAEMRELGRYIMFDHRYEVCLDLFGWGGWGCGCRMRMHCDTE